MDNEARQRLDLLSPLLAGTGAFIGAGIFMLAYQFIFRNDARFMDIYGGGEYFMVFCLYALVLPIVFAYSMCTCTCYRKGKAAFSYGSIGGAIGAASGFCIFMFLIYIGIMIASLLLFIAPLLSGIFSYAFHRAGRVRFHNEIEKSAQDSYYHPMTYQFYQYPIDHMFRNSVHFLSDEE